MQTNNAGIHWVSHLFCREGLDKHRRFEFLYSFLVLDFRGIFGPKCGGEPDLQDRTRETALCSESLVFFADLPAHVQVGSRGHS